MKYATLILCAIISLHINAQKSDSYSKSLDAMITSGVKEWQVPGLAALVVKDGEVVFKKTYGVKDMETKEPVDGNTLFNMGSTTKAVIALSIGMLVDQGKIKWDDKVRDHLPSFRLSDHYITADARIKDLLTHNLGIGNADLLWVVDSVSTEETIARFRHAESSYPLRGGFTYQNIMYTIAGEAIEAVSGMHWTDFVQKNVFDPLKMNRSMTKSIEIIKAGNYTTPHYNDFDDGLVKVGYTFSDQIGAAGMIWTSISDMGNYMTFLVNDGVFEGDTLLQPATFNYLFKPHSFVPETAFYPTQQLTNPNWTTYGLGWFQHDYRGKKLDFHTGSIAGLVAIAGIMHEHNTAVYVLANLDHAEIRHAIMYKAIDLFAFYDDSRDWHEEIFELYSGLREATIKARKEQLESQVKGTDPALPLDDYVGTYKHDMYGFVVVTHSEETLHLNFNDYLFHKTTHWQYNAFRTDKHPKWRWELMVNFNLSQSGKVGELEVLGEKFVRD